MRALRGLHIIRGGAVGADGSPAARLDPAADGDPPTDGRLGTLDIEFSRFDTWYRIDSWWEGTFMERTARGAFRRTIANNRNQVKVLFNHGFEFNEGEKMLGPIEILEERDTSPFMSVALLDAPFARNLAPGLRAGLYGSSFMFEVVRESWNREPEPSESNPEGLPERTIEEVRLFEAGPVTWPANPEATSVLRCGTDWYAAQLAERDEQQHDELVRSFTAFRALHGLRTPDEGPAAPPQQPDPVDPAPGAPPARHSSGMSRARRERELVLMRGVGR
jgi:HK97 family phage prohead protease